jgi:hypothetical protein
VIVRNGNAVTVTLHQSWLNNWLICEARAMYVHTGIVTDSDTEATILGTALHYGIEVDLRDNHADPHKAAVELFTRLATTTKVRWVKNDMGECRDMLEHMWRAWAHSSLRRQLKAVTNAHHELKFDLPFHAFSVHELTVEIRLAGMIDYIAPPVIYDWKTAGQAYKQWEKQRWAIQPTAYSWAAVQLGLAEYPVKFRYGTFSKKKTKSELEIIEVERTEAHASWLRDMIVPIVTRLLAPQDPRLWVRNDQHALCSSKYCPAWDKCKGNHINTNTW